MNETAEYLINLGVAVGCLVGIGWWLYKKGWPWVVKLVADLQAERRKDLQEFLKALKRRDEINHRMISELNKISQATDKLVGAVVKTHPTRHRHK